MLQISDIQLYNFGGEMTEVFAIIKSRSMLKSLPDNTEYCRRLIKIIDSDSRKNNHGI